MKFWTVFLIFLVSTVAIAQISPWELVPSESKITFTGTQNGSPITGEFKKFTAQINFDPTQLNNSNVRVIIDTDSVSTAFVDIANTLKTSDWLDVKKFPQAIFAANKFSKINDNTYQALGELTIHGKTLPMTVTFVTEQQATKGQVKGKFSIKRSDFGVGQGEWASTDEIKNDVQVDFLIAAVKK